MIRLRFRAIGALAVALMGVWGSDPASAASARPAKICAACHGPIKRAWEASAKAKSWTNPVFQAFLSDAKASRGDAIVLACLACHAPQAAVTGDIKVEDPVAQEGITCNFCHNVSAVEASPKPASYTHDASNPNLMRGPYEDSDPGSAHDFAYSEIHTKGDFCASCHWAKNDHGIEVVATYPSWKASEAAAAATRCQDCHMPASPGKASPISKKQRTAVNLHTFTGPRVPGGLDSVATVFAEPVQGRLKLTVRNTRGGHALPGGGRSMRAVTLEVIWRDAAGKELSRSTVQTYGTEFADSTGKSPVPKWLAASVARSREIPADSSLTEWADIPAGAARAEAVLTYQPLLPIYRERLAARRVDLTGRDPVVLARAEISLP